MPWGIPPDQPTHTAKQLWSIMTHVLTIYNQNPPTLFEPWPCPLKVPFVYRVRWREMWREETYRKFCQKAVQCKKTWTENVKKWKSKSYIFLFSKSQFEITSHLLFSAFRSTDFELVKPSVFSEAYRTNHANMNWNRPPRRLGFVEKFNGSKLWVLRYIDDFDENSTLQIAEIMTEYQFYPVGIW